MKNILRLGSCFFVFVFLSYSASSCKTKAKETVDDSSEGKKGCVLVFYKDADSDGYTDGATQVACGPTAPYNLTSITPLDCDDNNASIYPGAPLNCNNGKDNDCSGHIETWFWQDQDSDTWTTSVSTCANTMPEGFTSVSKPTDCDDLNPNVNPGQTELCDGIDNNCAGGIDEGFAPCSAPSNLTYFFVSADTVGLRWQDNSPNEQGFIVQVSTDPSFSNPRTQTFSANTTEGYIRSLQQGTTYYLRVYAFNSTGNTTYSNTISATTSLLIHFEGAIQISLGSYHTCAIKQDSSLWCWGLNYYGQLGDGTNESKSTPVQIMAGVSQVSLGGSHTCAVKQDNSLWCWGWNGSGQLGNGTTAPSNTPVQIMTGVSQVSLGSNHTCAIKQDNSLWCWGNNYSGQLGDGTTEHKKTPVQIMTGVSQVSSGAWHTCAVKQDNSLWCWGLNYYGQLGDGTNESKSTPVQIMTGVSQVSLGVVHTCAIKQDNSLWCWGNNYSGQLGDGTWTDKNIPVQITQGVSQISLGGAHTCAVKQDNSLWCWGNNYSGQLGDGTTWWKEYPVRVLVESDGGGGGSGGAPHYFGTSQADQTEFTSDQDQKLTSKFGCSVSGFGYLIFFSALPLILLLRKRTLSSLTKN